MGAIRGEGWIDELGRVAVASADGERTRTAKAILVSVGTNSTILDDIEALNQIRPWTNREAASTHGLPQSLVILGAGPTGVEMSQVYARYGVPTVLVSPHDRINPKDHPLSSATLRGLAPRRRRHPDRRPSGSASSSTRPVS